MLFAIVTLFLITSSIMILLEMIVPRYVIVSVCYNASRFHRIFKFFLSSLIFIILLLIIFFVIPLSSSEFFHYTTPCCSRSSILLQVESILSVYTSACKYIDFEFQCSIKCLSCSSLTMFNYLLH